MKKISFLILAAVFFACQTSQKEVYTLTGEVAFDQEGTVYLQDRIAGQMVNIDSTTVKEGTFVLNGSLEHPRMLYLQIEGMPGRLAVFLENKDITLTIQEREPLRYTVNGSRSHEIYTEAGNLMMPFDERLRALRQEITQAEIMEDPETAVRLRNLYEETDRLKKKEVREFIKQHTDQEVAVFIASRQLSHGLGHEELSEIFSIFDESLEGTSYYDDMAASVKALKRVAVGQPAIDFTLQTPSKESLSLSDFKGQYVLISFWASWCPYCREENPSLVKVYNTFHNQNFEILGVSLDRNEQAWRRGIKEDGLLWPQVSDLQGWRSGPAEEYAVRSIPQNVLINPEGIIIKRNLKYDELTDVLKRLLSGEKLPA